MSNWLEVEFVYIYERFTWLTKMSSNPMMSHSPYLVQGRRWSWCGRSSRKWGDDGGVGNRFRRPGTTRGAGKGKECEGRAGALVAGEAGGVGGGAAVGGGVGVEGGVGGRAGEEVRGAGVVLRAGVGGLWMEHFPNRWCSSSLWDFLNSFPQSHCTTIVGCTRATREENCLQVETWN